MDDLKIGELVGTDKYGNKYFENKMYFYGKLVFLIMMSCVCMSEKSYKNGKKTTIPVPIFQALIMILNF